MKIRNFVVAVALFLLCMLCCSCAKPTPNDFTDSRGYLDGKPLSRSWIARNSNGEIEIVGQATDEIGHTDNSKAEASLTACSRYCGAPLYYIIPVRFSSKKQCQDFLSTAKSGEVLRVTVRSQGDRFAVSRWSLEGKQLNNGLPHGGDISCPWGEYCEKFPQGTSKGDTVKLKSFKSVAYEYKETSGQYRYQTLTSGKVYSVPILMSINILSKKAIKEFEPDYYKFKKISVVDGQWVCQ